MRLQLSAHRPVGCRPGCIPAQGLHRPSGSFGARAGEGCRGGRPDRALSSGRLVCRAGVRGGRGAAEGRADPRAGRGAEEDPERGDAAAPGREEAGVGVRGAQRGPWLLRRAVFTPPAPSLEGPVPGQALPAALRGPAEAAGELCPAARLPRGRGPPGSNRCVGGVGVCPRRPEGLPGGTLADGSVGGIQTSSLLWAF